jgi:glycosyltransferase involved in cell wall biosynthesis
MRKSINPLVSVTITTKNEEKTIERSLRALRKQTYRNIEIIVTDDCSNDRTVKAARKYADKVIVQKSNIPEGRNISARHAKGKYLVLLNADVVLEKHWIENALKRFEEGNIVMLMGVFSPIEKNWKAKVLTWMFLTFSKISLVFGKAQVMGEYTLFLRRSDFKKVRGFNEELGCYEEPDLGLRLKKFGKIVFEKHCRGKASFRRFEKEGYLKWLFLWMWIGMKYYLTKKTAKIYTLVR